jgi:hypothetical protein
VRRKKLREILDAEAGGDSRTKKRPQPAKRTMLDAVSDGVKQGSEKPKKRGLERRYGPKGKTIDEIIEE